MHEQQDVVFRGLTYPFGRGSGSAPEPGAPREVADGVYWARFPMPMSLDHINIWLLRDGDGWAVVDTCLAIPEARDVWERLFTDFFRGAPLTRVICTHMHPDHVGLAGWLTERFETELWMTREEFLMCRAMAADTGRDAPEVAIRFYRSAGFDEAQLEAYRSVFGNFGRFIHPLPDSYRRLVDGETLRIDDRYWEVVVGGGHSPEHAALYCPALKLMISGDQVLPKISSNISVFPTEPEGDPLREWLNSCAGLRERLPDDLLVLPAHETPFYGLHVRLTQLIEGHERGLDALYDHLAEPRRAVECYAPLFDTRIGPDNSLFAIGETLAHLNCLLGRRRIARERGGDGVQRYRQLPESAPFERG
jgi:glyoxylase-like metal-dependent hydrolase (beta-lactamase superfamily II)